MFLITGSLNAIFCPVQSVLPVAACPPLCLVTCLHMQDRPAIQLYQPGIRSRNRTGGVEAQAGERKAESQTKSTQEKGEE